MTAVGLCASAKHKFAKLLTVSVVKQVISSLRAPKSSEGYRAIGGGSPLRRITLEQADALQEALGARGQPASVYVAMRYWKPFTEDAVAQVGPAQHSGGRDEMATSPCSAAMCAKICAGMPARVVFRFATTSHSCPALCCSLRRTASGGWWCCPCTRSSASAPAAAACACWRRSSRRTRSCPPCRTPSSRPGTSAPATSPPWPTSYRSAPSCRHDLLQVDGVTSCPEPPVLLPLNRGHADNADLPAL